MDDLGALECAIAKLFFEGYTEVYSGGVCIVVNYARALSPEARRKYARILIRQRRLQSHIIAMTGLTGGELRSLGHRR